MTTISATSILSSRQGTDWSKRIDTLVLRYPRCIHAEFMTHRVFSRNASSSRAIPVEKLIQDVLDDPFVPIYWGKNQKGMQADEEQGERVDIGPSLGLKHACHVKNEEAWILARDQAVTMARAFAKAGYHKQIVNRLLEPFGHITVVVTSTQWSNFFALRDHPDAEPHIQILAREMRKAIDGAPVQELKPGDWHLPFIRDADVLEVLNMQNSGEVKHQLLKKLSVARCASTSYKTVDDFDMTFDRAVAVYDKMLSFPIHASPFEHQCEMDRPRIRDEERNVVTWSDNYGLGGNLGEGVIQLRKTLPNECL